MPREPEQISPGRFNDPALREELAKISRSIKQNFKFLAMLDASTSETERRSSQAEIENGRMSVTPEKGPYAFNPEYLRIDRDDVPSGAWSFEKPVVFPAGQLSGDITVALQSAVTAAAGGVLVLPSGTGTVSSPVSVPSNTAIVYYGAPGGCVLAGGDTIFSIAGTEAAGVLLTADGDIGDNLITVADASGFAAGDLIRVDSEALFVPEYPDVSTPTLGQIFRVVEVDGSNLLLDTNIDGDRDLATGFLVSDGATAYKITPATNVMIFGVTFQPTTDGVTISNASGIHLRDCSFTAAPGDAISATVVDDMTIIACSITESATYADTLYSTTPRFGITLGHCRNVTIGKSRFRKLYAGVYGSGVTGPPSRVTISDCTFDAIRGSAGVDASGLDWSVDNCTLSGRYPARAEDNTLAAGVKVTGGRAVSVSRSTFKSIPIAVDLISVNQASVNHSNMRDVATFVAITDNIGVGTETNVEDVAIESNTMADFAIGGIVVDDSTVKDLRILFNRIDDNNASGTASVIEWGTSTITDGLIRGNTAKAITGSATIESGTPTETRVKRQENRTVGCDNYWDNDGVKQSARTYAYHNEEVGLASPEYYRWSFGWFGNQRGPLGSVDSSVPPGSLYRMGNERIYVLPYSAIKSPTHTLSITGYRWNPSTGLYDNTAGGAVNNATWNASDQGTVIATSDQWSSCGGFWTPAAASPYCTFSTTNDGSPEVYYYMMGSGWTFNEQLVRVTRVGIRALPTSNTAFIYSFTGTVYHVGVAQGTNPYTTIGTMLHASGFTMNPGWADMSCNWYMDTPNLIVDGRRHEFICFKIGFDSSPTEEWDDIETWIEYTTDFRISD